MFRIGKYIFPEKKDFQLFQKKGFLMVANSNNGSPIKISIVVFDRQKRFIF